MRLKNQSALFGRDLEVCCKQKKLKFSTSRTWQDVERQGSKVAGAHVLFHTHSDSALSMIFFVVVKSYGYTTYMCIPVVNLLVYRLEISIWSTRVLGFGS